MAPTSQVAAACGVRVRRVAGVATGPDQRVMPAGIVAGLDTDDVAAFAARVAGR